MTINRHAWAAAILLLVSLTAGAQERTKEIPNGTDGLVFNLPDSDLKKGFRKDLAPNEFDGNYSTFKIGLGFIYDFSNYVQDAAFKQQMDSAGYSLGPTFKVRDFRVLTSGVFKLTRRPISWKFAYMYDGNTNTWLIRETGLTIGVPELKGDIFVGRTKEGFSMVKVMNGHSPWGYERQMALDPIPILADGIKYFGYLPKTGIFLNLGAYTDWVSKGQSFSTFKWQYVARVGWMHYFNKDRNELLHAGINLRYGKPEGGEFIIKSRPESNPTPQILNTGTFAADHSSHLGYEIYYNRGSFLIGSEAMVHNFYSDTGQNHRFVGGNFFVTFLFNHGRRPYRQTQSLFGFVNVPKSITNGGWGQWEVVLHFSTFDLNDGNIHGGQFWRITPMVNWYMTKITRFDLVYGYGIFDRYGQKGHVQFFESRIQFTIL